jgi:valyl-tRNA synthetase
MPFLTEELWHRLGAPEDRSISLAAFPPFDPARYDSEAEREMSLLQEIVVAARGLVHDLGLDPKQTYNGRISGAIEIATEHAAAVQKLGGVSLTSGETPKSGAVRSTAWFDLSIDVPHGQMEARRKRLEKERDQLEKNIANSRRQLSDDVFLSKAPAKVIDSIRAKLAEYETQLGKVAASLNGQ